MLTFFQVFGHLFLINNRAFQTILTHIVIYWDITADILLFLSLYLLIRLSILEAVLRYTVIHIISCFMHSIFSSTWLHKMCSLLAFLNFCSHRLCEFTSEHW